MSSPTFNYRALAPYLLVIGYVWPEPNTSAAGSHMMHLLHTFRQADWHVIFANPAQQKHMGNRSACAMPPHITLNYASFDQYGKEEWALKLINGIILQIGRKDDLRNKHFLGKMLRLHTMRSTQYMSQ